MTDATNGAPGAAPPQMNVLSQFVRNIEFRNIAAEEGKNPGDKPTINVQVNVENKKITETRYAVNLATSIEAKSGSDDVFTVNVSYVGVFEMTNVPDAALGAVLAVECPRMLFPFSRRVIADATRDGGFPPLLLDPIDFGALYRHQLLRRNSEAQQEPAS